MVALSGAVELRGMPKQATELHVKVKASAKQHVHKELLPIGEGAYQSAEAVEQRTTDKRMHCEDGKWGDCLTKDKSDLLDGHSYGNIKPAPKPYHRSSAARVVSVLAALLPIAIMY